MVTAPTDPNGSDMTVDEIARHAGIPTSTIRMYQQRGLLPPPERRGRVGFYGAEHRDRLRLIAHLQERGFSLAAIKEAIDAWAHGRSLDHLLGIDDLVPTLRPTPLRLTLAELAERFDAVPLTQGDIVRAVDLGLIEVDGTDVVVADASFLDVGPAVARLGVPVAEILDQYEALQQSVDEIAERFRSVFDRHVWQPFVSDGLPPERVPAISDDVARLSTLATSVVTAELRARFAHFVDAYLDEAANAGDTTT